MQRIRADDAALLGRFREGNAPGQRGVQYQEKSTEEARFVYAADKIIAEMNVYLEGNTINVEKGLTVERIRKNKDAKIALSPHLEKYWREFIPLWQELEEKTMPGKNKQSHYRTERK